VPGALIRLPLLVLLIEDKFLQRVGSGGIALQRDIASSGRGSGLVGQRLGDVEEVDRRRANRPRIAENGLIVTIKDRKLRGVGFRRAESYSLLQFKSVHSLGDAYWARWDSHSMPL